MGREGEGRINEDRSNLLIGSTSQQATANSEVQTTVSMKPKPQETLVQASWVARPQLGAQKSCRLQ